ncbi:hypothetical protein Tco_0295352 [Tanacetum coccineum]
MPPGKLEHPDLVVVQSRSGIDYHQPMSQLFDISGSAYPEYPLSHNRCLSALRSEDSNYKGGDEVGSGNAGNTDAGGDIRSRGDGICGNGDDSGVSGDGGGVVGQSRPELGAPPPPLDLQRVPTVPAVLSHVPVVTASMSKSAQAAPVRFCQMFVMLQSLPASCGLPVAPLRSQSDSYGQLPVAMRSLSTDSSL